MCCIILSQHDQRSLFEPYFNPDLGPNTEVHLMPGNHSTIVVAKAGQEAASELVKNMAKRFLIARGTFFKNQQLLSTLEILEKYAKIADTFDDYAKNSTKVRFIRDGSGKHVSTRRLADIHTPLSEADKKGYARILPIKPAFFFNEDHREAYQSLFPNLTNEIDLPPEKAFRKETRAKWMAEFDSMMNNLIGTSRMTLFYMIACDGKQSQNKI